MQRGERDHEGASGECEGGVGVGVRLRVPESVGGLCGAPEDDKGEGRLGLGLGLGLGYPRASAASVGLQKTTKERMVIVMVGTISTST